MADTGAVGAGGDAGDAGPAAARLEGHAAGTQGTPTRRQPVRSAVGGLDPLLPQVSSDLLFLS